MFYLFSLSSLTAVKEREVIILGMCDRLPGMRITIVGTLSHFNAGNMEKQSWAITENIRGLWGESETGSVVRASITGLNLTRVTFRTILSFSDDHFVFTVLRKM
jgi:hypothetical protein